MDHTAFMEAASGLLMVIAMLVGITNVVVEVLKAVLPRVPANYLAIGTAQVITMLAFFAWLAWADISFVWYYLAAALILGIMVAYAAMFGFDKLKETFEAVKKTK